MPEQKDRRSADAFKLGADVGQRQVRIVCMLRPGFLVESWQGTLIVARKDQAAIRKNAFRVDEHAGAELETCSVAHAWNDGNIPMKTSGIGCAQGQRSNDEVEIGVLQTAMKLPQDHA